MKLTEKMNRNDICRALAIVSLASGVAAAQGSFDQLQGLAGNPGSAAQLFDNSAIKGGTTVQSSPVSLHGNGLSAPTISASTNLSANNNVSGINVRHSYSIGSALGAGVLSGLFVAGVLGLLGVSPPISVFAGLLIGWYVVDQMLRTFERF